MTTDLHVFNELRPLNVFATEAKKHIRREVRYAYGRQFYYSEKNSIKDTNIEKENLDIQDPLVQKRRGRPPNSRIKSASETLNNGSSGNSAVNPPDPNLYVRVCSDTNNEDNINSSVNPLVQKRCGHSPKILLESTDLNVHKDTNVKEISQQQYVARSTVDSYIDTNNALGESSIANNNTIKPNMHVYAYSIEFDYLELE
ncbi:26018_t:CDS:2 [Gigaspora rosea]|nr:26018_t:CDS:2 [Gigaspora rosea]